MGTTAVAYDDEGEGPVVVPLHAGVADRRMWAPLAAALRGSHRVVAPDLRGFGETPMPPGEFSFAEDVLRLLDGLGIEQAAFVGASLGGQVALDVTALRPDRVAALLLLCPAFRGIPASPELSAFGDQEDALLETDDLDGAVELNVTTWLGPGASAERRDVVRRMQRHAFEVQLVADSQDPPPEHVRVQVDPATIAAPTLVVSGGHDLQHFQMVAEQLTASIPGAEHRHLRWAGHLPSPEPVRRVLRLLRASRSDVTRR